MKRKAKAVFIDVGPINEPVSQCIERVADAIKWEASRDIALYGEHCKSYAHAAVVESGERIKRVQIILGTLTTCRDIQHMREQSSRALRILNGGE